LVEQEQPGSNILQAMPQVADLIAKYCGLSRKELAQGTVNRRPGWRPLRTQVGQLAMSARANNGSRTSELPVSRNLRAQPGQRVY